MKRRITVLLGWLLFLSFTLAAQLQTEQRLILFPTGIEQIPYSIRPEESIQRQLFIKENTIPQRRFLRVIGGIEMPGRFSPRGETFFREAEFLIDDHLDSIQVYKDPYTLYFHGKNAPYEQEAYYRIPGNLFKPGKFRLETAVKTKGIKDNFGIKLEVFYQKEGYHPDEVYHTPDTILYLPITGTSGDFKQVEKDFEINWPIGNIVLCIGGRNFQGECWIEAPAFHQSGEKLTHIAFSKFDDRKDTHNYWVGINLSARFWPKWKLQWNDETIFHGNLFDRASDIADFYIPLPSHLSGSGTFTLTLEKEPHLHMFPYALHALELIEESARPFEIVSLPRYISAGESSGILVEINQPDLTLAVRGDKEIQFEKKQFHFAETGLHVLPFNTLTTGTDIQVCIESNNEQRMANIQQIIQKGKDEVYLSSGDEIHIDNEFEPYNYFFKWYIKERIGNWYQFRPSYQWSGVRITTDEFVKKYTGLLNQLQIPYAWQVEGRTLAATRINPSLPVLQSPMFRGKQAHENDGGYYYWQHFHYNGFHSDMAARTRPYGGIFAKHPPIYTDYGTFIHYDPYKVTDMADGARYYVENLAYSRGESTRHTGPSSTFRYLYQAGYEWLGAEQMYGPEETIMSALRGASRAYHKKDYGSLHAVQWGSFPFTDPKHSLRFYLSLAVSYMHGSNHINTEEGLWTDEYANDRYSESGKAHINAQHLILDYIETHTRRGEMHTPIAVLYGRNDGWKSFGRSNLWSQRDDKWKFNKALESYDLLNIFYPENEINACGPEGWFTSTPYGAVDILPIEADKAVMSRYKALLFLGWNTFCPDDFERLTHFVEQGGILLLSAAHLNSELQPDQPVTFPENDKAIKRLLGNNYRKLSSQTVLKKGKGRIIYYPQPQYPAEEELRSDYERSMREIAHEINPKETDKGWIKAAPFIDFTVWDTPERRTIYILNTDWDSENAIHPATFKLNQAEFTLSVPQYKMATIHSSKDIGVYAEGNTTDILDIQKTPKGWDITVQTTGQDRIHIFNSLNQKQNIIAINGAGIETIHIPQ